MQFPNIALGYLQMLYYRSVQEKVFREDRLEKRGLQLMLRVCGNFALLDIWGEMIYEVLYPLDNVIISDKFIRTIKNRLGCLSKEEGFSKIFFSVLFRMYKDLL